MRTAEHSYPDAAVLHRLLGRLEPEFAPIIVPFAARERQIALVRTLNESQRMIRWVKEPTQVALCEFSIGLYYFFWQENLGAIACFQKARTYWQISNERSLVGLALLAEASANHCAERFEEALVLYTKVGRQTKTLQARFQRIALTGRDRRTLAFLDDLYGETNKAMELLRRAWLTPPEPIAEPTTPAPPVADVPLPIIQEEPTPTANRVPQAEMAPPPKADVPPPIIQEEPTPTANHVSQAETAPLPKIAADLLIPAGNSPNIPPILQPSAGQELYYVAQKEADEFLPMVQKGDWVVVDTSRKLYRPDEYIVLGGNMKGSVGLGTRIQSHTAQSLYYVAQFIRDANSKEIFCRPFSQSQTQAPREWVIGSVIGFYRQML